MKYFTIRELADAIEKNGLPHAHGAFFKDEDNEDISIEYMAKITSACALGQAAINLGVKPLLWRDASDYTQVFSFHDVVELNEEAKDSLAEIANYIRTEYPLDIILEAEEFDYTPYL
jgi:hypothetical protein